MTAPPPMPEPDHHPEACGEPAFSRDAITARDAQWQAIVSAAVAAERKACAKLCEKRGDIEPLLLYARFAYDCAQGIRARAKGQA